MYRLTTKSTEKKTIWRNAASGYSGIAIRRVDGVDWTTVDKLRRKARGTVSRHSLISRASGMSKECDSAVNKLSFLKLASYQRHRSP